MTITAYDVFHKVLLTEVDTYRIQIS